MTHPALLRAAYLYRRIRETSPRFLTRKVLLEAKKRLYWVPYTLQRFALIPTSAGQFQPEFFELGQSIRDAWLQASRERPELARRNEARVISLLETGWPCLGYGTVPIPVGRAWHSDPVHSFTWPIRYIAGLDFVRVDSHCDVKIPWELSRLQYLIWFSEAVITAPNVDIRSMCRNAFVAILEDWVRWNPVGFGINWVSAMEVAIRAINLILATAPIMHELDDSSRSMIVRLLVQHRCYLAKFPEISDVNGNHHLAGLLGAQYLTFALTSAHSSQTEDAVSNMIAEFDVQFEPDGCHHERSIAYHKLCLEFAIYCAALCMRCTGSLESNLAAVLSRALSFTWDFSTESYHYPLIGDGDSGSVINYQQDCRSVAWFEHLLGAGPSLSEPEQRLVRLIEAVASRPAFLSNLFGEKEAKPHAANINAVSRSGFVALRGHGWAVFSRTGAHGLAGRAPHDHDDNAAAWVSLRGEDLLVEHGCHSYTLSRELRAAAIASSSHNVICVAGTERYQQSAGSVFATARNAPVAALVSLRTNPVEETTCAAMDIHWTSFVQFGRGIGIEHYRQICIDRVGPKPRIVIDDHCEFTGSTFARLYWHLAPGWSLTRLDDMRHRMVAVGRKPVLLQFEYDVEWTLIETAYDFSYRYGISTQAKRIELQFSCSNQLTGRTVLLLDDAND